MPEFLHPGVYLEEVPSAATPIQGVPTSTAAFLGETEKGPVRPQLVTSFGEYQRLFGGPFAYGKYMPHAVHGFFENGGGRLYVCRIVGKKGTPVARDFEGNDLKADKRTGLAALALPEFREVSLVYAPGIAAPAGKAILQEIIAHCERLKSRFAVIDCAPNQADLAMLDPRTAIAPSSHAAFYCPWIVISDPRTGARRAVPPGGHVLGIYARTDGARGVFKPPANEIVRGALDLEVNIDEPTQEMLNPCGVNAIRHFPGRGIVVWGARTLSTDPDWRYVSVRRYATYLEVSISEGTRWATFEPNGEPLWARVKRSVEEFLLAQWRQGALMGTTPDKAFFVKCDRTTMTQADIDQGRLICLIGVAVLKPAEFVIFRIGQQVGQVAPCPPG